MSLLSTPPSTMKEDAVMNTLEKFIQPENIGMKTNLTPEAHAAEIELLAQQRYFKKEWGIDIGYDAIVKDYDVRAVSIKDDKYHRVRQAMEVMIAQQLEMKKDKDDSIVAKLLGS
jgi:hypothetical protein